MKLFSAKQYSPLAMVKLIVGLLVGSSLLSISHFPQLVRSESTIEGFVQDIVPKVISAIQLGKEIFSTVLETWNQIEKIGNIQVKVNPNNEKEIFNGMNNLSVKIKQSEQAIQSTMSTIISSIDSIGSQIQQLSRENQLRPQLQKLADLMNLVNDRYQTMRSYLTVNGKVESYTLEDFASNSVSERSDSVSNSLKRINSLVEGSPKLSIPSVLELMLRTTQTGNSSICSYGMSAQQILYQLYSVILITELKGFSMMQFSYMILKIHGKGNFFTEAKLKRIEFMDRTKRTQTLLQQFMSQASREYWRCDPIQHEEGETFVQMTRLLQGYIENEGNMNVDDTCKETCSHYSWGVQQQRCPKDDYCSKQVKCAGKIYSCDHDVQKLSICPAANSSSRRYEYIEYEDAIIGPKKDCTRGTTNIESEFDLLKHIFSNLCDYCFCLCDDAGPTSDRYINMRESVSDVMHNKVVTGLRFVKQNQVIHLIVQEGTLLPHGQIDNSTVNWIGPEYYNIRSSTIQAKVDYNVMNYDNRIMDLDDILLQPPYVVTGVRFRLLGTHMNLEVRMTEMDIQAGKLINPGKSKWRGSDETEHSTDKRTEFKLNEPDVPILSRKSDQHTNSNQFIRFRESDRKKDASQTTVPFFDGQPVVPTAQTPLGGCGIFHKGQSGFGGFIAPKVFTYDAAPHVDQDYKENPDYDRLRNSACALASVHLATAISICISLLIFVRF